MTKKSADVGSTWEIPAKGRVTITRPDGTEHEVDAQDGVVRHVLDQPGQYSCGDESVTAK